MRPRRHQVFGALVGLAVWGACISPARPAIPESPGRGMIAEFLKANPGTDILVIQQFERVDIRFDAKKDGLVGHRVRVDEYLVRDRDDLLEVSHVVVLDSPLLRLKDVVVERRRGDQVSRFRRKDLRWSEGTGRGGGVVYLDHVAMSALVPGLEVGDRLKIIQKHDLRGLHAIFPVTLGRSDEPCQTSVYEVAVPRNYDLTWGGVSTAGGASRLVHTEQEENGKTVHRWHLSADEDGSVPECRDNRPTFGVVPHITRAGSHHRPHISVGADWAAVGQAHLERIENVFEADDALRRLAAELTAGVDDPLEKIDRIYAGVQRRCRYLGLFEGTGGIVPIPAAEVLEAGFGDCKGLGTLLIALLRASGFDSHPVLVLAGEEPGGLDPDIPNMAQFNHYIAWVDTGDGGLFLDGTVDHCPAGLVPLSDAGSPVLLLKPGAVELVEIPSVAWDPGEGVKIINGSLDTDGRLTLTWDYRVTGNQGRQWRNAMTGRGSRLDDYIRDGLMPEGLAMRGGKPEVRGMDDWRGPLEISLAAELDRPLPGDERSVFLPRVLTGSALDFDPHLICDRPVDLRMGLRRRESWSIELPAGMVLAGPDSLSLVEQGVAWSSRVWQEGRVLRLERALTFDDMTLTADQADELEKRLRKATRLDDGYLELVWK